MKTALWLSAAALVLASTSGCNSDNGAPCAQDSSVAGCVGPATGYSCGNGETPDENDSSLVCSDGTPGDSGFTLYCCVQFTSSTCQPDTTVQGCEGSSIGFSCTGTDTPDEADSSLNCSDGTPSGNELLYCCAP
ncbi:MAG TPA: hypothetical protein VHV30_01620 [Polyangiaceae bacterium]|jgi:hypothetical protein|nr:hypothetical protein [Polyangiaceae bacterium]